MSVVLWTISHSQGLGFPAGMPGPRKYIHERAAGNTVTATSVLTTGHLTEEFSGLKHSCVSGTVTSTVNANVGTWSVTALADGASDAIVFLGTNEITAGTSAATTKANLQTLVNTLVGYGLRVHLILICPRNDSGPNAAAVATYNTELAAITGTTTMINPAAATWWSNGSCLQADNIHLSPTADINIARDLLDAMREEDIEV